MHRYLVLCALLGVQALVGWRMLAPPRVGGGGWSCRHPVGVVTPGRDTRVVCIDRDRTTTRAIARMLELDLPADRDVVRAGQLVRVEQGGRLHVEQMPGALRLTLGLPIGLNDASAETLQALPRIGPVLAARIVAHRRRAGPFPSVAALTRVRGIGPKTVEHLRGMLTVEHHRDAAGSRQLESK